MPSLKPGNELEPPAARKVPIDYRPAPSTDHHIADGENWGGVASRYGIDVKDLISANFKTLIPEEVNWYLHHYINCDTPTPDGYNWRFSTSARRGPSPRAGIIYIPLGSGDDDVDQPFPFKICGTPAPESLPPWVAWNPRSYRAAVRYQLTSRLQGSRVARGVIAAITRTITIRPAKHARDPGAHWNASEGTVYYTPGSFIHTSRIFSSSAHLVGYSADAVLLHELVHAMRTMQGHYQKDQQPVSAIHYPPWASETDARNHLFFGKRGEFNAIVITNTYLSEMAPGTMISGPARNRLFLVKDHHLGHAHMALAAPDYFHKHPPIKHLLKALWNEQPVLCRAISTANAQFNPIRAVRTDL